MSLPIEDKVPVAPLELPVKVSPTVKSPAGIFTVNVVEDGTALTVVDCALDDPVIVSEVVNVPLTLVIVNVNALIVRLTGLYK